MRANNYCYRSKRIYAAIFGETPDLPDVMTQKTLNKRGIANENLNCRVLKQATVDNLPVGVRWISGLI